MTGPNLLAWAKKITQWPLVGPRVEKADIDLFDLARAILADEEERKRKAGLVYITETANAAAGQENQTE